MMKARNFAIIAVLFLCVTALASAASEGWLDNYEQALAKAKAEKKPVLANFTGSDWCIWCKKLKAEVFETDLFMEWARENTILLELDYPNNTPQSEELKKQNQQLGEKYQPKGFPTVMFLDAEGEVLGQGGYVAGGPEKWIAEVGKIIDPKAKVYSSLDEAAKAAGEAGQMLLVFLTNKPTPLQQKVIGEFFESNSLATATEGCFTLARLEISQQTEKEAATLDAFMKKFGVKARRLQFVLVDIKKNELIKNGPFNPKNTKAFYRLLEKYSVMNYDGRWLDDFEKASKMAAKLNKPIFLDFTGSDWCGWCIKLKKEVFDTDEFKKFAADNIILVEVDLPQQKQLPAKLKAQNRKLVEDYKVTGYPTCVILNSRGKEIGRIPGYMNGGPQAYIKKIKEIAK